MEADLTLEKAKRLIRQREAVKEQGSTLKSHGADDSLSLESLGPRSQRKRRPDFRGSAGQSDYRQRVPKYDYRRQTPPTSKKCRRCGKEPHPIQQCPARQVVCFKCNRKGHFQKQCLSKTVAAVTGAMDQLELQYSEDEPDFYLDTTSLDETTGTT